MTGPGGDPGLTLKRVRRLLTGGVEADAPAKLNLWLQISGRRADGYHLLDSLFHFTKRGDRLLAAPQDHISLKVVGFEGKALGSGTDNLVERAARLLASRYSVGAGASLTLVKHLPVASGIGGGSADAAATLLALNALWNLGLEFSDLAPLALSLGADVPACLLEGPLHVTGIGEHILQAQYTGPRHVVLVNPRVSVATPSVFKAFGRSGSAFTPAHPVSSAVDLNMLDHHHNALQPAAASIAPQIYSVLDLLGQQPRARLVRMSGSGATCFALFDDNEDAAQAASQIRQLRPAWWVHLDQLAGRPNYSPV